MSDGFHGEPGELTRMAPSRTSVATLLTVAPMLPVCTQGNRDASSCWLITPPII